MGRVKKHLTEDDRLAARRLAYRTYYWKNKESRDLQSKLNYKKKNKQKDGRS